jgi:hypothetical protein
MFEPVTIKGLAAGTAHDRIGLLRWELFPTFPHGMFPRGPIALVAPGLEIDLGPFRQKRAPRVAETRAGLVEGRRRAGFMFAGLGPRIESAMPFPLRRIAGDLDDRADMHVAVMDQPAFTRSIGIAASGEGGGSVHTGHQSAAFSAAQSAIEQITAPLTPKARIPPKVILSGRPSTQMFYMGHGWGSCRCHLQMWKSPRRPENQTASSGSHVSSARNGNDISQKVTKFVELLWTVLEEPFC